MTKVKIVDPAGGKRNGWRDVYGTEEDALNGNVSRVFLTGVPTSVPTTFCYQPDDWSCGPYSLAECLGQGDGEDARNWLLARGLIDSSCGTYYEGIVGYLNACGYSCEYDGIAHDGEMDSAIFAKIVSHLQNGHKVILCMHGTSKGCRTNWYTYSGHYICVYDVEGGSSDSSYSFTVKQIKLGDTGNDVLLLQKILRSRGMYKGKLDKSFGPQTDTAVRAYQQWDKRLVVDGVCGPATWECLLGIKGDTKVVKQIKPGDVCIEVYLVQEILRATGRYKGALDMSFGPATQRAVLDFQKAYGLKEDCIVGPATWKKLIKL